MQTNLSVVCDKNEVIVAKHTKTGKLFCVLLSIF